MTTSNNINDFILIVDGDGDSCETFSAHTVIDLILRRVQYLDMTESLGKPHRAYEWDSKTGKFSLVKD